MTIPRQRGPQQALHPPVHKRQWRSLWRRCACGHSIPCPAANRLPSPIPAPATAGSAFALTPPRPEMPSPAADPASGGAPKLTADADVNHGSRRHPTGYHLGGFEATLPIPRRRQPPGGSRTAPPGIPAPSPENPQERTTAASWDRPDRTGSPTAASWPPTPFPHLSPPTFSPANEAPYDDLPGEWRRHPRNFTTPTRQRPTPQRASPAAPPPHRPRHGTTPLLHRIHTHSAPHADTAGTLHSFDDRTSADAPARPLTAVRGEDSGSVDTMPPRPAHACAPNPPNHPPDHTSRTAANWPGHPPARIPRGCATDLPAHPPVRIPRAAADRPGHPPARIPRACAADLSEVRRSRVPTTFATDSASALQGGLKVPPQWNAPTMPLAQIGRAGDLTPAQAFRADRGPA